MSIKDKRPLLLRRLVIFALIASFIYLATIFGYQHHRYSKVKNRITTTYNSLEGNPGVLRRLDKMYTEVDNLFRDYTKGFNPDIYQRYVLKLNGLKQMLDTLSSDRLAIGTLSERTPEEQANLQQEHHQLQEIVNDIHDLSPYLDNSKLVTHEKKHLVETNDSLLQLLNWKIEIVRETELLRLRQTELKELATHKKNVEKFQIQLTIALIIMISMIAFILFYQSEVSSYEQRLHEEKDYAAQVAEEKTNLLANISHEVRTPISSLLSIIELLKKNSGNAGIVIDSDYLDSAVHEVTLISNSVNDILSLSKLEVGDLAVKNDYFSPYDVIEDVLALHNYPARKKKLLLSHELNLDPDVEVYSNLFRLKQIISNLLSNAIKYTPAGRAHLSASIESNKNALSLSVKIKDTGIGIARDQQANIFEQYYMTDAQNKSGGYGLGLYISKLLAKQLQGDITVESKLGVGSIFSLTIPIQQTRKKEKQTNQYTMTNLPRNIRMVCIDDNEVNIFYLKHFFSEFPEVYTFKSPAEALEFTLNNDIDVVITDLHMPDIDGWQVLQQVKKAKQNMRVFLFTSDTMYLNVEQSSIPYTFDGVLNKPLEEYQLVSTLLETGIRRS